MNTPTFRLNRSSASFNATLEEDSPTMEVSTEGRGIGDFELIENYYGITRASARKCLGPALGEQGIDIP
jgi:hypothetical protein